MKKDDRQLNRLLSEFASLQKPDEARLSGAVWLAEQKSAERKKIKAAHGALLRRRFAAFGAAFAVVLVIGLGLVGGVRFLQGLFSGGGGPSAEKITYYTAAQLTRQDVTRGELDVLGIKITDFHDGGKAEYTLYRLKSDSDPIMVETRARYDAAGGGTTDALIRTELRDKYVYDNNKLYFSLPAYGDRTDGEVKANNYTEDGEYISAAYIKQTYSYCIYLTNPEGYALDEFLSLCF